MYTEKDLVGMQFYHKNDSILYTFSEVEGEKCHVTWGDKGVWMRTESCVCCLNDGIYIPANEQIIPQLFN